MPITIRSIKGYYFLDAWIMANIIQLSTQRFAERHLNRTNDPCGRMLDQMTMAARSATANIAEGATRHQTSRETEMRLTDVARASLSELPGDFFYFSMARGFEPWSKHSEHARAFSAIQLDRPSYTDDWQREAWLHIMTQKKKFDPWTEHADMAVCVNSMMILINRLISMLQKMIGAQLQAFKEEGGFTENLTHERVDTLRVKAAAAAAPSCPVCGRTMIKRVARKGRNTGQQFWSCPDYPACNGTRHIDDVMRKQG